jgi:hypothetical protein
VWTMLLAWVLAIIALSVLVLASHVAKETR